MSRDDAVLRDLLAACLAAQEFIGSMTREQFVGDKKTRSAILHQLLVLGEATKRLSIEFRERHPRIPWREMTGMRDRVIHAYDQVDLDMVWIALKKRLPVLLEFLEQHMGDSGQDENTPQTE